MNNSPTPDLSSGLTGAEEREIVTDARTSPAPSPEAGLSEEDVNRVVKVVVDLFATAGRMTWVALAEEAAPPIRRIVATRTAALTARAEAAEAAMEHNVARIEELRSVLDVVADRLDEFTYDEFASVLSDEPCDADGVPYKSLTGKS